MKRFAAGAIACLVLLAVPVAVSAQIEGSAHDFSDGLDHAGGAMAAELTWNGQDQLCGICHTPHNPITAGTAPLWDRATTVTSFTMYSSTTMDADLTVVAPANESLVCLSCHDGVAGLEDFGGATGGTNTVTDYVGGYADLGDDLSNDHPVSFTYNLSSADTELHPEGDGSAGTVGELLFGPNGSGRVECSSCHDVHNNGPVGAGHLLRITNAGSALCLRCHNK